MAQRKPTGKKVERKEQSVAQSALTSPYNIMIPLMDAAHVWVTHPVARKTIHCSTSSESFLTLMKELFDLGVGPRLEREFAQFAGIDPRWEGVAARVTAHVTPAEPAEEAGGETIEEATSSS